MAYLWAVAGSQSEKKSHRGPVNAAPIHAKHGLAYTDLRDHIEQPSNTISDSTPASPNSMKLFYLHFAKSGGTTVHQWLEKISGTICPLRETPSTRGEELIFQRLHSFDLVSGHFLLKDALTAREMHGFQIITTLRRPADRLVSTYNFLNAHNPDTHPALSKDSPSEEFKELVHELHTRNPESFFSCHAVKSSALFNNYYATILGAPPHPPQEREFNKNFIATSDETCQAAIERLKTFDFICKSEEVFKLVGFTQAAKGLPLMPVSIQRAKKTADEMRWHDWMRPVKLLGVDDLPASAQDLLRLDQRIYESIDTKPKSI